MCIWEKQPVERRWVRQDENLVAYKVLAVAPLTENEPYYSPFTHARWMFGKMTGKLADGGVYCFKEKHAAMRFRQAANGNTRYSIAEVLISGRVWEYAAEAPKGTSTGNWMKADAGYRATRARVLRVMHELDGVMTG